MRCRRDLLPYLRRLVQDFVIKIPNWMRNENNKAVLFVTLRGEDGERVTALPIFVPWASERNGNQELSEKYGQLSPEDRRRHFLALLEYWDSFALVPGVGTRWSPKDKDELAFAKGISLDGSSNLNSKE